MTVLSKIRVFATTPHKCSYLEDREATTLFVDPAAGIGEIAYRELSEIGFRRSGKHYYRPHCQLCDDCIPVRIPVNETSYSRSQKRTLKRNADLSIQEVENIDSEEHYALYARYIESRHENGDMYPPSQSQYQEFLVENNGLSSYVEFRLEGQLVAVNVLDRLPGALSAIYTFFDPEQTQRSLGSFAILNLLEQCKARQLHYVYLGYWIKGCRKMSYKINYRPIELYIDGHWRLLR